MKKDFIQKIIIFTLLLFMPMSCYGLPIVGVTYGDLMLIVSLLFMLLYMIKIRVFKIQKKIKPLYFYMLLVIINSIIVVFLSSNINLFSLLRYLLFVTWSICAASISINNKEFFKHYKRIGLIFALYAIFQTLLFIVSKKIIPADPLKFIFGNSLINYYNSTNIGYYLNGTLSFRAYSVFLEPSYFAMFEMPLLLYMCNMKKISKSDLFVIVIIMIAMFCGRTITGLLLGFLVIILSFSKNIFKNKKSIVYLILVIVTLLVLSQTAYFQKLVNLVIATDGGYGTSLNGRIQNYSIVFGENTLLNLFGHGVWVESDYLPSLGRILLSFGILGTIVFTLSYLISYINLKGYSKKLFLLFIVSFVGTNSLFNITSVLCFSLIFGLNGDENDDM